MINDTTEKLRTTLSLGSMSFAEYTENMCLVAKNEAYDLILVNKWCYDHRLIIYRSTDGVALLHKVNILSNTRQRPLRSWAHLYIRNF